MKLYTASATLGCDNTTMFLRRPWLDYEWPVVTLMDMNVCPAWPLRGFAEFLRGMPSIEDAMQTSQPLRRVFVVHARLAESFAAGDDESIFLRGKLYHTLWRAHAQAHA